MFSLFFPLSIKYFLLYDVPLQKLRLKKQGCEFVCEGIMSQGTTRLGDALGQKRKYKRGFQMIADYYITNLFGFMASFL